jgi:membrane-associated protein
MITALIVATGYVGIFIAVFAESGFLFGFFLPGDSLVFTIGILASQGSFNIFYITIVCLVAAIAGDSFGYWMGKYFGPKLFTRQDSWLFKREYVDRTQVFYEKHGTKTIILARFIPIVRTFAPIMAGIGRMNYRTFLFNNVIGGTLWILGFLGVSYFLGRSIPGIDHYLVYIIAGIILISVLPVVWEMFRKRK